MLRCYKTANPAQYKDFESNLFSEEDKLHTIVFYYASDKVTIDSVDYVISKIEESKNEPDQVISTTLGAITIQGGNMNVNEANSAAILAKETAILAKLAALNIQSGNVTETNSASILAALAGISGGGNPLDLYVNTKVEDLGSIIYLGYEKPNTTKWYIKKYDGSSFLFANSVSNAVSFATAWANRATLSPAYVDLQTLIF